MARPGGRHKKRSLRNLCVFQSACEKPESDVREPYTVLLLEVSLYRYARVFGAYSVKGVDAGLNIIGGRDPPRHRRSRASPLRRLHGPYRVPSAVQRSLSGVNTPTRSSVIGLSNVKS